MRKPNPKPRNYTVSEISKIRCIVRKGMSNNLDLDQLADKLNTSGVPTASGKAWTKDRLQGWLYRHPLRSLKVDNENNVAVVESESSPDKDRLDLATAILSSNLGKKEQLTVLSSLFKK